MSDYSQHPEWYGRALLTKLADQQPVLIGTAVISQTDSTAKGLPTGSAGNPAGHTDGDGTTTSVVRITFAWLGWESLLAVILMGLA